EATGDGLNELHKAMQLGLKMGMITISPFTLPKANDHEAIKQKFGAENIITIETTATDDVRTERLAALGRDPGDSAKNFEALTNPDLQIDTTKLNLDKALKQITSLLSKKKFIL
ncbi:hypothetical protein K1X76_11675, partial [bacterium]|nr:hypothetical protein [bacterium]